MLIHQHILFLPLNDHHLSAGILEIIIKDLTKRLCQSLRSRFMICIGKSNKDKITTWKNFVEIVRISREYLRDKLDIQIGIEQEKGKKDYNPYL